MATSGRALDSPARSVDGSDNYKISKAADDNNPLLKQAGKDLSDPRVDQSQLSSFGLNRTYALQQNTNADFSKIGIGSNTSDGQNDGKAANIDKPNWDGGSIKVGGINEDIQSNTSEEQKKVIQYFKPIEIKIAGILDGSVPVDPNNLDQAKSHFLQVFKRNGGKASTAEKYINKLIKDNHELAEYGKTHNKKTHYISDNKLAACLNELSKVYDEQRTNAKLSKGAINSRVLELTKILGEPNRYVNQGQVGSCALHASLHYEIVKAPQEVARVASQILRTGKYRGAFSKYDMGAAHGETAMNHLLGTAQLRATYNLKHLTAGYGGTDTDSQAQGIKRFTRRKIHAVFSRSKLRSNGAALSYWPGHALVRVVDVRNGNLYQKEDNTWDGFNDGRWNKIG